MQEMFDYIMAGGLAAVGAVFVVCIVLAGRYVLIRMFDSKDGIVTTLTARHIAFLDHVESTDQKVLKIADDIESTLKILVNQNQHLIDLHVDPNSPVATRATNKVLRRIGRTLHRMASNQFSDDSESLAKINQDWAEIESLLTEGIPNDH